MSSFSGLSAILSVSLVALLTVQMLKDKFEVTEYYGELDEDGNKIDYDNVIPYNTRDISTPKMVNEEIQHIPVNAQNLSNLPLHSKTPFKNGDFFTQPYVSPDLEKNGYDGFSAAHSVFLANINAGTPSADQLNAISSTDHLPGPLSFNNDSFANANVNTGRSGNLNLCSQNYNTHGAGNSAVASSLLPNPGANMKMEGFSDCDVTNPLSNQVFLSASGRFGVDTVSNSTRNSNLQIRSEPPNPKLSVGPWNNSTIYPDLLNRPLEGCGPSFGQYGTGPYGSGTPTSIDP